mmetsp:Transcript_19030/g.52882  ORF Transcript_19030/g.52882 Transcript_19030/m.52882 type:complete len:307 (+) Transcript_19030:250-1170(+)
MSSTTPVIHMPGGFFLRATIALMSGSPCFSRGGRCKSPERRVRYQILSRTSSTRAVTVLPEGASMGKPSLSSQASSRPFFSSPMSTQNASAPLPSGSISRKMAFPRCRLIVPRNVDPTSKSVKRFDKRSPSASASAFASAPASAGCPSSSVRGRCFCGRRFAGRPSLPAAGASSARRPSLPVADAVASAGRSSSSLRGRSSSSVRGRRFCGCRFAGRPSLPAAASARASAGRCSRSVRGCRFCCCRLSGLESLPIASDRTSCRCFAARVSRTAIISAAHFGGTARASGGRSAASAAVAVAVAWGPT